MIYKLHKKTKWWEETYHKTIFPGKGDRYSKGVVTMEVSMYFLMGVIAIIFKSNTFSIKYLHSCSKR